MTKEEIIAELERRTDVIIANSSPGDVSTGMSGSFMRFDMTLAPIGYPFGEAPEWLDWANAESLLSHGTFHGSEFDEVLEGCFNRALKEVNGE